MAATAIPLEAQSPRKVILVTANKGGAGKTTTCVHLLTAAAKAGLNVLGIDLEPQHNLSKWAKRRPAEVPKVRVIEGTMEEYAASLLVGASYDLVVIDTPPGVGPHINEINAMSKIADAVLVPTGLDIFDIETVVPYARALHAATGEKPYFIMNRIDSRITQELTETISLLSSVGRVNALPIPTLTDIGRYMRAGLSIVDVSAKRGTPNVTSLWNYISAEVRLG